MKPKYDDQLKFKVLRDHKLHPELSIRTLAQLNNCSNSTVSNWLRVAKNYKIRQGELRHEMRERIIEHFNRSPDKTQKQIGIECGCSGTVVSRILTIYFEAKRNRISNAALSAPETIDNTTQW